MAPSDDYLIWSNEHRAWWAPGETGYTPVIGEAGHYPRHRAIAICRRALLGSRRRIPNEIPVRSGDVAFMYERRAGEFLPADED